MTRALLALFMALCASAASQESSAVFQSWVESQNGTVERNASGAIVGVNLAHSWATDADLGRIAALGQSREAGSVRHAHRTSGWSRSCAHFPASSRSTSPAPG